MMKTQFLMGKEKDAMISTTNANYQPAPDGFKQVGLDEEKKANLRRSHFAMDGHPGVFNTTN